MLQICEERETLSALSFRSSCNCARVTIGAGREYQIHLGDNASICSQSNLFVVGVCSDINSQYVQLHNQFNYTFSSWKPC